jgi:glycogen synthase
MDNFDDNNAIIIKDNIIEAFNKAIVLYNNKKELNKKRSTVMSQDFSWDTRQKDFIRLYESV